MNSWQNNSFQPNKKIYIPTYVTFLCIFFTIVLNCNERCIFMVRLYQLAQRVIFSEIF